MTRKLFTLAAGVSAVLGVGVCVLWVRSYWVCERVYITQGGPPDPDDRSRLLSGGSAQSNHGWLEFEHGHRFGGGWFERKEPFFRRVSPDNSESRVGYVTTRPWASHDLSPRGIDFDGWTTDTAGYSAIFIRHWIVLAPLAVAPAVWLVRRRLGNRRKCAGCCRNCGYDLRATPDRCPECGTVPATKGGQREREALRARGGGDADTG
jgi:hypothetical protein